MKTALLLLLLCIQSISFCQGLEDIIVEIVPIDKSVFEKDTTLPKGAKTYRIYADLAPEFRLLSLYGEPSHELRFETTTKFYNNVWGGALGEEINPKFIENQPALAYDSWLTLGAATKSHYGIPLSEDTDGSELLSSFPTDGLIKREAPTYMKYHMEGSPFESGDSSVFSSYNSLIGVLGGVEGPTAENKILLAQITTDGQLSFELNMLIGSKSCGEGTYYVAKNPTGDQVSFDKLTYKSN